LLGNTGAVGEVAADNFFSYDSKTLDFCSRWVFYIIFDSKNGANNSLIGAIYLLIGIKYK
jgi:hypothetical protein